MISGRTALFGVLGHPVAHSLSPAMQNAAFAARALDAAYVALPVPPERLAEAVRGAHALGFQGLNVTVPHKQQVPALCRRVDATAAACGAVNTLRRDAEGWEGFNTDAPACRDLLREAGVRPGARGVVLGAGGAALAAAWALLEAGLVPVVVARHAGSAAALRDRMRTAFPTGPAVRVAPWDAAAGEAGAAAVVVNATTLGLAGEGGELAALPLGAGQVVVDFVYGDTAFARRARAAGAVLVTGEQVLVRQGALAFTLWTGQAAPEAAMAAALRQPPPAHIA